MVHNGTCDWSRGWIALHRVALQRVALDKAGNCQRHSAGNCLCRSAGNCLRHSGSSCTGNNISNLWDLPGSGIHDLSRHADDLCNEGLFETCDGSCPLAGRTVEYYVCYRRCGHVACHCVMVDVARQAMYWDTGRGAADEGQSRGKCRDVHVLSRGRVC